MTPTLRAATRTGLLLLSILAAAPTASATMTFSITGTVVSVDDPNGDGPSVAIGDPVEAIVTYEPSLSFLYQGSSLSHWYEFDPGGMTFYVTVNGQEFILDATNSTARTLVQYTSPHLLRFDAVADPIVAGTLFDNAYPGGRHFLEIRMFDSVAPLELLGSLDLPAVPGDVDMSALSGSNFGFVDAENADRTRDWGFAWTLERVLVDSEAPVRTESRSFGAVKATY